MQISDLSFLDILQEDKDVRGGLTIDSPYFVPDFINNPFPRSLKSFQSFLGISIRGLLFSSDG